MTGGRSGGRCGGGSGGWAGGDYAAAGDAWAHAADDVVHGALARYGRPGSPAPRVLDVGTDQVPPRSPPPGPENKPGPLRAHRSALEAAGRRGRARASPAALFEEHNRATDGSVRLDVPYLLVHAEVRAEPEPHRSSGTNKVRRGN
ncbi:hypothetical protein [Streptomyces mutabilis]|uniref:hypothetical protein n=1 Tax=Streptomyces mutabilis TaxID=67332 RepID=UPI00343D0C06